MVVEWKGHDYWGDGVSCVTQIWMLGESILRAVICIEFEDT